jgi:hypothetical protein
MLHALIDSETNTKNSQQFPVFWRLHFRNSKCNKYDIHASDKDIGCQIFFFNIASITLKMDRLEAKSFPKC